MQPDGVAHQTQRVARLPAVRRPAQRLGQRLDLPQRLLVPGFFQELRHLLAVHIEQMEVAFGAGDGDVEQAALLLQPFGLAKGQRALVAVGDEHCRPL